MTKDEFITGVLERARQLREAGLLGKRSVSPTERVGKRRGRPPKPAEPDENDDLLDEIEEPLESDL